MSASEIRKQAKDVKKNINLAKHNTELNFLEEFILKQCYSSKKYIYDFLSKILDIQNEEFTIQKYSIVFRVKGTTQVFLQHGSDSFYVTYNAVDLVK